MIKDFGFLVLKIFTMAIENEVRPSTIVYFQEEVYNKSLLELPL